LNFLNESAALTTASYIKVDPLAAALAINRLKS